MTEHTSKCVLCDSIPSDPRLFPCLHTYCGECALSRLGGTATTRTASCVVCGDEHVLQGGEVSLTSDVVAIALNRAAVSGTGHVTCGLGATHGDRSAVLFCAVCEVGLCDECVGLHQTLKPFAKHPLSTSLASAAWSTSFGSGCTGASPSGTSMDST